MGALVEVLAFLARPIVIVLLIRGENKAGGDHGEQQEQLRAEIARLNREPR